MDEEEKKKIIQGINEKVGYNIRNFLGILGHEKYLVNRRNTVVQSLDTAFNEVPSTLSTTIKKAEQDSKQIQVLKNKSDELRRSVEELLKRTEPLRTEVGKRFHALNKLEQVLMYLKSFEKVDELSQQMKQTNDDEQLVLLYGELKEMCNLHQKGHQASYIKEYTHYWHNVLKDKISKNYEDILKSLKWPFTSGVQNSPPSKEVMVKFYNITRYLFLIQEPDVLTPAPIAGDYGQDYINPCLPVRILLRPLKKRFMFHFTGSRQTARIDRPEWFLTQTLTWIKDHQTFVRCHVQPVAEKLELRKVRAVDEFIAGLIALAAERLHTVLAIYHTQGAKGEIVDMDTAFAHAVDETLGFNRELITITGQDVNSVLSVLTKAETFVRWLAVEKKYALSKMDETLSSEQWVEAVAAGVEAATGAMVWVPRAADWFISLLKTIEDRYAVLPQPGHRLQFLELQLELMEEWRVRLTQLLSAAIDSVTVDTFLTPGLSSHPLIAVMNAAHYTYTVLLQWAHSLHYLQLHYYRRQFQYFTQQQHHEEDSDSSSSSDDDDDDDDEDDDGDADENDTDNGEVTKKPSKSDDGDNDEAISLKEVEDKAKKLALNEISRRESLFHEQMNFDITAPIANLAVTEPLSGDDEAEEAGVFADAPALLARLRDAGLTALAEHILLEFKAGLWEYKRQKWQSLPITEELALSVSPALCAPLARLCTRMNAAIALLAPALSARLRGHLANSVDTYIFEEIVLLNWFNTGGTTQFIHDVKRNLVPAFAPPNKVASEMKQLPKLLATCKILNMDYDDAVQLHTAIANEPLEDPDEDDSDNENVLFLKGVENISNQDVLKILKQRTDLNVPTSPTSVLELF